MASLGKKLHHYVPQFYLKAWDKDALTVEKAWVFCLQNSEIRRSKVRNVGAENHFYRLRELNEKDIGLIRELAIADSPEKLKPVHEHLLWAFSLPHAVRKRLETSRRATPELLANVDNVIAEMNENLHTSIEQDFKPFLHSMLKGDLSFYSDREAGPFFFRGIAVQYLRTNQMKRAREFWKGDKLDAFERIANVLAHIYAVNLGRSFYADRERYKILLLENATEVPFVTADQPVINIASNPTQTQPPDKFELYYPLSPTKAMLLVDPSSDHLPLSPCVTAMSAHVYNLRMGAHSYRQIFGSSAQVLESVRSDLPAFRSCL